MDDLKKFTLHLSLTKGIGPRIIQVLMEQYKTIDIIFEEYKKGNIKILKLANLDIGSYIKRLQRSNISFVGFWESSYPSLLKTIPDFPIILFYVGNSDLLLGVNNISVVGTRNITAYGQKVLKDLIPRLVGKNVIVSGLAFGVDYYAHKFAIENNGQTIAVLPCSPNISTPKGNDILYKKILDTNNLVISEFSFPTAFSAGLFPRRNRIIAGISNKTIVIEAAKKSGAIITANLAFDYNREVYAIPGNINAIQSQGTNNLIKRNIANLLNDYSQLGEFQTTLINDLNFTPVEKSIYCAILPGPKSLEVLSKELQLDIGELSSICTKMCINGILNTDTQNNIYLT